MTPSTLHLPAPAKINLHLRVLNKRADGFHDIITWMQAVDWCDELSIRLTDSPGVTWQCNDSRIGPTRENLVIRAAEEFARLVDSELRIDARLLKHLPIGGGMGGGSSDAAAMIRGLAELWNVPRGDPRLSEAAAAVGSDVPFFLTSQPAIARGRGTELSASPRAFDGWAVLVLPNFGTSTPRVYAACKPSSIDADEAMPFDIPWRDAAELSARLRNDLLPAAMAVEPRLSALHGAINGVGGVRVHLSGSGSTMFALFDDEIIAEKWQAAVADCGAALRRVRLTAS